MYRPQIFFLVLLLSAFMMACDEDPVAIDLQVPATYSFERNGQSSVSYDGQTERIEQLTQIRSVLNDANSGNQVSGQDLLDMYANKDGNGGGNFDFTSTKQLKDKTFLGDQAAFDQFK